MADNVRRYMARLSELIKDNYKMPNISCREEEGQEEEGQENGEAEDPLNLVIDDNEQEE